MGTVIRRRGARARSSGQISRAGSPAGQPKTVRSIYDRMGRLLHLDLASEADVVTAVKGGISSAALNERMRELGAAIVLIGPESTIRRRVEAKQPLSVDESERLVRLVRIKAQALDLFDDEAQAQAWLTKPGRYLEGEDPLTPYELAVTDAGARLIEGLILKTAHGMF